MLTCDNCWKYKKDNELNNRLCNHCFCNLINNERKGVKQNGKN